VVHQSDIAAARLPEGPGLIAPTWPSAPPPASKSDRGVMAHWPLGQFDRPVLSP